LGSLDVCANTGKATSPLSKSEDKNNVLRGLADMILISPVIFGG